MKKANARARVGDERPCQMRIRQGTDHACCDGIRKRPQYLGNVLENSVMDTMSSISGNTATRAIQCREQHEKLQLFVTPGEYLLGHPRDTTREEIPSRRSQRKRSRSSCGFVEESKSQKGPMNPTSQQSVVPVNYPRDVLSGWKSLGQQDINISPLPQIGECNEHVECASNADSHTAFAIKDGWCYTFN